MKLLSVFAVMSLVLSMGVFASEGFSTSSYSHTTVFLATGTNSGQGTFVGGLTSLDVWNPRQGDHWVAPDSPSDVLE